MDPDKLARALADRFQRIVPAGFDVDETNVRLWYLVDAPPHWVGDTAEEQVAWLAEHALSAFQDYVDETSAEPWPGTRTVPRAHAAVIEGKLHLWFGDADNPILECEPIDLATLE